MEREREPERENERKNEREERDREGLIEGEEREERRRERKRRERRERREGVRVFVCVERPLERAQCRQMLTKTRIRKDIYVFPYTYTSGSVYTPMSLSKRLYAYTFTCI